MVRTIQVPRIKKIKTFKIDDKTVVDVEIDGNIVVFKVNGREYSRAGGNFESVCIPHPTNSEKHICFDSFQFHFLDSDLCSLG